MKVRLLAVFLLTNIFLVAEPEAHIDSVRISPDRGPCGPTNQPGCTSLSPWGGSSFIATYVSLDLLVEMAYGVPPRNVEHLERLGSDHYDVSIKPESGGSVTLQRIQPMLRDFLKQRFHLETHSDKKEEAGYALLVAKGGPKLHESGPDEKFVGNIDTGSLLLRRAALDQIAALLSAPLGKAVVNQTGVSGTFNVDLLFAPEGIETPRSGAPRPSIFTAVQEQLGLKLEAQKITADILVIDRCEHAPNEN